MKILNVCTKYVYHKNGEPKTKWYKIGIIKVSNEGRMFFRRFDTPYIDYYIFDHEPEPELPVIDLDEIGNQS